MKTNHRRNFVRKKHTNPSERRYMNFSKSVKTQIGDKFIGASSTNGDHSNGKHGIAKDRKGAKKFIRTRIRFHENQATKKLLKNNLMSKVSNTSTGDIDAQDTQAVISDINLNNCK